MQLIQKLHREEIAKLNKNKAVLEQQVELLTIQLHEASEREKNLKKTYTTMIQALQQKQEEELRKSSQKNDHDSIVSSKLAESPNKHQNPLDSKVSNQTEAEYQHHLNTLKQDIESLQRKLVHVDSMNYSQVVQMKTQEALLVSKEEQVINLKSQNLNLMKKLQNITDEM